MEINERIIEAANSLFMKYGARSVTMDDIARELSVSKKTIYQYYTDKDEIVTLVSQAHIDQEKEDFNKIFETSYPQAVKNHRTPPMGKPQPTYSELMCSLGSRRNRWNA